MKSTAIEESVFYHLKVHRWHEDLKSCVSQEVGSVKLDLHREFVEVIISILPLYLKYKKKKKNWSAINVYLPIFHSVSILLL